MLIPAASHAETPGLETISRGTVRYLVGLGGLVVGKTSHQWQRDSERYSLESSTETVGLAALFKRAKIRQVSEGRVTSDGLQPKQFRVYRDGAEPSETADFDWPAGKLSWGTPGAKQQADLSPGAQDAISLIWQLALRPPEAKSEFAVTTGKGYNRYPIERLADEKIASPVGELNSRHYRTIAPPGERSTEVWLATDYHLLPVRVRYLEKSGEAADMVIEAADFGPVQLSAAPVKGK